MPSPSSACRSAARAPRARPGRAPRGRGWRGGRPPRSRPRCPTSAAMSRLPKAWPAEPGLGASSGREAVLEQARHRRLGVRQRRDAVADVAHRRDAQLLAQLARRAAVVGDRHDRRDVAGHLLEAAQQRRQAGAAADGHDARPARERALLVHELDERLACAPGTARAGRARSRHRPISDDGDAERDDHERTQRARAGTAGSRGRRACPARLSAGTSRNGDADRQRARRREEQSCPRNTTSSQRLMPVPGRSQRRSLASRLSALRSVTGASAPGARRSPDRGPAPRRSVGQRLRDGHRAMEPPGAADGRRSGASCPRRGRPGSANARNSCRNVEEALR